LLSRETKVFSQKKCSVTIDVRLEQWKKRLSSDIMRNDNKTQRKDSITTWKIIL